MVDPMALMVKTEDVAKPPIVGDWISKSGKSELDEVAAMVKIAVGEVVPSARRPALVRINLVDVANELSKPPTWATIRI